MNNSQEKIFWCCIGIIIGCIISNGNIITAFISSYLIVAWGMRILVSHSMQSGVCVKFLLNPAQNALLNEIKLFDNPNITMEYNWYHNTVFVNKNITATFFTNNDKIESCLRKVFNDLLYWDVLYHVNPLKFVYT